MHASFFLARRAVGALALLFLACGGLLATASVAHLCSRGHWHGEVPLALALLLALAWLGMGTLLTVVALRFPGADAR